MTPDTGWIHFSSPFYFPCFAFDCVILLGWMKEGTMGPLWLQLHFKKLLDSFQFMKQKRLPIYYESENNLHVCNEIKLGLWEKKSSSTFCVLSMSTRDVFHNTILFKILDFLLTVKNNSGTFAKNTLVE